MRVINFFAFGEEKRKSHSSACVHRPPGGSENGRKEGVKVRRSALYRSK